MNALNLEVGRSEIGTFPNFQLPERTICNAAFTIGKVVITSSEHMNEQTKP